MNRAGMAGATVNLVGFHEIKGDNVLITKVTATWSPVASWAIAFSKDPLGAGVPVILEIEGSGHVDIGIIQIDPQLLKDRLLSRLQDIQEFLQINEVKVYRRKCSIRSTLEPGGKRVVTNHNGKDFKQTIIPGTKVWLAVYVKFGDIMLKLRHDSEAESDHNPILSEVKGMNLEFCTDGKNKVRTISSNPAAICFISKPLNIGQKMSLVCEPLKKSQGEMPSQFHLKINIANKEPKQLQQQHKNLFTVTATNNSVPQWVCSEIMERLNCSGLVTIERAEDHVIFTNGMNERTNKDICTDQKSKLWIALDLYRVLVRQVDVCAVVMDVADGPADGYLTPLLVAQKSDEYLELKPQEQKKPKEIQQQEDKYPLVKRSVSAGSYTGDYSDRTNEGYITPVAVTKGHHDYLELKPEEKKKHHSYTERIESTQPYTFVTGKEPKTPVQEKITSVQSKPAEDLVYFESSFNGYFADLVKNLTALELCDHLISLQVITMPDFEKISSKDTSHHQNRDLLLLLCKKPVPKLKFIAVLKDSGNGHLIEKFFPAA